MDIWLVVWCTFLIASVALGLITLLAKPYADNSVYGALGMLALIVVACFANIIGWLGILGWFIVRWIS